MKIPLKYRKQVVYKAPIKSEIKKEKPDSYRVRLITARDIERDPWLNKRKKIFNKMLNYNHIGLIVLDLVNECVAYGWIAVGNYKPDHLPRMPKNSAWLYFDRVKNGYNGRGLQRLLIKKRIEFVFKNYGNIEIYSDTSIINTPSRINYLRCGFYEYGIYYILNAGTRSIPSFYLSLGKWFKNKKHPKIIYGNKV